MPIYKALLLLKYPNLRSPNTKDPKIIRVVLAFFSISFLLFGINEVMVSSYAEPQRELTPQQQQQLQQQQGLTPNATAPPSPQLQQQQQQAPPITFQGGGEEPCDGAYFIGPGGVTKCM